jgi:hypothetical protein
MPGGKPRRLITPDEAYQDQESLRWEEEIYGGRTGYSEGGGFEEVVAPPAAIPDYTEPLLPDPTGDLAQPPVVAPTTAPVAPLRSAGVSRSVSVKSRGGKATPLKPLSAIPKEQADAIRDLQQAQADEAQAIGYKGVIEKKAGERGEEVLRTGAEALEASQAATQVLRDQAHTSATKYMVALEGRVESHRNMKVDDDFFGRSTTGSKIGMIASALLGGWMNPYQDGTSPAIALIERSIQRDIHNQEKAIAKVGRDIEIDRAMFADSQRLTDSHLAAKDLYAARLWGNVERMWNAEALKYKGQAAEQEAFKGAAAARQKKEETKLSIFQRRWENDYKERTRLDDMKKARMVAYAKSERLKFDRGRLKYDRDQAKIKPLPENFMMQGRIVSKGNALGVYEGNDIKLGNYKPGMDDVLKRQYDSKLYANHDALDNISKFYRRLQNKLKIDPNFIRSAGGREIHGQWLLNVQMLARSLEVRITDEDFKKYKQILPGPMNWTDVAKGSPLKAINTLINVKLAQQKQMMSRAFEGGGAQHIKDNLREYYMPTVREEEADPSSSVAAIGRATQAGDVEGSFETSAELVSDIGKQERTYETQKFEPVEEKTGMWEGRKFKKPTKPEYTKEHGLESFQKVLETANTSSIKDPRWNIPGEGPQGTDAMLDIPGTKGLTYGKAHDKREKQVLTMYTQFAQRAGAYQAMIEEGWGAVGRVEEGVTGSEALPEYKMLPKGYFRQKNDWDAAAMDKIKESYSRGYQEVKKQKRELQKTERQARRRAGTRAAMRGR